ncbi:MAG TPA: DUF2339 domain-containing protein [Usitatibacter sp.]|jgi:uncharacterized membrane protein|nr:DUF2339 domain-containing protein [Usitatibacter sp.]
MKWLGLVIGVGLGLALSGQSGDSVFVLGVLGFVAGLVYDLVHASNAKGKLNARLDELERTVSQLSMRFAATERRGPVAPAQPEVTPIRAAAPVPVAVPPPVAAAPEITAPQPPHHESAPPNFIVAWLTGGNTIARVGLLILFFGLAFLLKFAVDHSMVPPELRVGGVALTGIALLVGGWRLRGHRPGYALGLQGGGVAVLYLVTFAALRLYHLIPPAAAFFLLAAIAVFSAILAIAEDALVLAVFGTGGGFLAPILASTGEGSHVALFSYYLVLNLGIAIVALRKSWRSLNIMGFAFTFFIGLAWGYKFYKPEFLATTEPFLIAFFLLYVAIAILHARRDAPDARRVVDGTIVFGVPLGAFGLQAALMQGTEFGLAFSCVGAAAMYLALAAILKRSGRERHLDLAECFLALGVVFATLAIPFALDARWTSAFWGLEGAAIAWVGVRQRRRVATGFGLTLQLAAGAAFYLGYTHLAPGFPWIDATFLGALLLALAGLVTSRVMGRQRAFPSAAQLAGPYFVLGICWWLFAAHHDIQAFMPEPYRVTSYVILFAATVVPFSLLSTRIGWVEARWPAYALLPALLQAFALAVIARDHPFAHAGWAAWICAFAVLAWSLHRHEGQMARPYRDLVHALSALLVAAVGAMELHWLAATYAAPHSAWTIASYAVAPCIVLLAIAARAMDARWPVKGNESAYRVGAAAAFIVALIAWSLVANVTHDGRSDPLPYLPLVNALDLAHGLAILAVTSCVMAWRRTGVAPPRDYAKPAIAIAGVVAFVWLNAILLRTIHHYADVPYVPGPMLESKLVQAALSIFWTVLALALMLYATRRSQRPMWVVGGALMAVVVVKLFVLDLSHVTGVERIVSFIAVGLLMLLVGYLAPVPPRIIEAEDEVPA